MRPLCCAFAVFVLLISLTPAMAAPSDSTSFRLDNYQWKNRLLLLFAPSKKAPGYEQQRQLFEATDGSAFAERDLLIVELLAEGQSRADDRTIPDEDAARLRDRFGVAPNAFAVILVGKDGTEKRRDTTPVKPEAIFDEIDAMPMRQREMERQRNSRQ